MHSYQLHKCSSNSTLPKERAWLSNLKTIVRSVRVKAGGVNIAKRGKYSKINLKLLSLRNKFKLKTLDIGHNSMGGENITTISI